MQVWNVLHAACWKYRTQKWCKKSPYVHHRTTLSGYIFATEAHIDNWKKNLLSCNISPTCSYNMVNFGPLAADIASLVWGTPTNFNGFRVLAALLHSQTAALNRGRRLYSTGRPSRWALAHISSSKFHQNRWIGFRATGVRKSGSPIDLACRPYNSSALVCWLWCLWPPYGIGKAIIFSSCGFFLLLSFFLFPHPISAVGHWMCSILIHMVWP